MTNWRLPHSGSRIKLIEPSYGGVTIPCGGSKSKASWSEQITSTPEDYYGLMIQERVMSWSGYIWNFDIGIGTSGSEKILIEEFMTPMISASGRYSCGYTFLLPFFIPAGSNLHVRGRTSYSSQQNYYINLHGVADNSFGHNVYAQSQWMNVDASNVKGRSIDPGATPDTWSSWVDVLDGPLAIDAKYLLIYQGSNDSARSTSSWRTQLAVGGSGSEQVIAEWTCYCHSSSDFMGNPYLWFPVQIPANTTLRNRSMCSIGTGGDRVINVAYYFFG
jgi:hypothetical protein